MTTTVERARLRGLRIAARYRRTPLGRLVQRAPSEAQVALKPYGYYEPKVSTGLTEREGRWYAVVKIEPGPPVMLVDQSVEITGAGRDEPFMKRALARSPLKTGEQLSHPAYDQLKGELLRAALGNGYLDAHGSRPYRARDRRALPLRPDDDRASRDTQQPDASLPALPGG